MIFNDLYHQTNIFLYRTFRVEEWKLLLLHLKHKYQAYQIGRKDKIRVVFLAMNVSMWRYQHIYNLLCNNKRFDVFIVLSPTPKFSYKQREEDLKSLRLFFHQKRIPFIDYDLKLEKSEIDIKSTINPDILFYPQPYKKTLVEEHSYRSFQDKLLCYYPYAFWTSEGKWAYDGTFHNLAWKLYYSTSCNYADAKKWARNRGRNVVVVGYPNADDYLLITHKDKWKPQNVTKKRIIWAPHFTIEDGISPLFQSNFLRIADAMLDLANKYSDSIQFAFKPHPRLLTELYKHPDWGKEKTDNYYNIWQNSPNTQIELGDFIDLFMTSDAMIHDSSSFSVEYLYTQKPVLFLTEDYQQIYNEKNTLGKDALSSHYIGKSIEDITEFISSIVCGGNDPKKSSRKLFFNKYLLPPNGKTVAENTYFDILDSLHIKDKSICQNL